MPRYPQRPQSHLTCQQAVSAFRHLLPAAWVFRELHADDYGVDAMVEIVEGESLKGPWFALQMKGTTTSRRRPLLALKTSTLNYLLGRPEPLMIALWVAPEDRCYWMWATEAKEQLRNSEADTARLRFEKGRVLGAGSWGQIAAHVTLHSDGSPVGLARRAHARFNEAGIPGAAVRVGSLGTSVEFEHPIVLRHDEFRFTDTNAGRAAATALDLHRKHGGPVNVPLSAFASPPSRAVDELMRLVGRPSEQGSLTLQPLGEGSSHEVQILLRATADDPDQQTFVRRLRKPALAYPGVLELERMGQQTKSLVLRPVALGLTIRIKLYRDDTIDRPGEFNVSIDWTDKPLSEAIRVEEFVDFARNGARIAVRYKGDVILVSGMKPGQVERRAWLPRLQLLDELVDLTDSPEPTPSTLSAEDWLVAARVLELLRDGMTPGNSFGEVLRLTSSPEHQSIASLDPELDRVSLSVRQEPYEVPLGDIAVRVPHSRREASDLRFAIQDGDKLLVWTDEASTVLEVLEDTSQLGSLDPRLSTPEESGETAPNNG